MVGEASRSIASRKDGEQNSAPTVLMRLLQHLGYTTAGSDAALNMDEDDESYEYAVAEEEGDDEDYDEDGDDDEDEEYDENYIFGEDDEEDDEEEDDEGGNVNVQMPPGMEIDEASVDNESQEDS